jgi:ATP-binding cassette subfamily C protein CydD
MYKKILASTKLSRRILAFTVAMGLAGTLAIIAQMALLSRIVTQVFLLHKGLAQVLSLLALFVSTIVIRAGLLWVREEAAQRAAIRAKAFLRERVFAHLLALGPGFRASERTGELAATLNEGIERLDAYIARYLPQLALSILVPVLIFVVILPVDWFSALLLLCTGPVIPLLMALVGINTQKRTQAQWATLSLMSAHFLDVMQGLTTLKLFGHSEEQQERIASISNRFRERTLQVLRSAFLSGAVLEFMTMTAIGVIATTLGVRLLNHSMSFDRAFFILLLTPEFYRPLQELGTQRHAALEGEASAQRLLEILEMPVPTEAGSEVDEAIPAGPITIDITDLSYTYPAKEAPALDHVTLRLPANTCTALVGHSGAGKSTLVNLLLRFIDGTSGTIAANGIAITRLSPERWREYIALVPQRPYLFYGTVRENIHLARPQASEDEVMHAAELAGVTAFLDELPHGFDTQVGEQGTQLSAGQAQRVAIARAFLKNAPLLILDEPTSCLDPDSEARIRQSLTTLMRDRTVLVIAHRSNTIAQAHRVVVLENGRITETGLPDELALSDGTYAHLLGAARARASADARLPIVAFTGNTGTVPEM